MTFESIRLSFGTENLYQDRVPIHREHQFLDHFMGRQMGTTDLGFTDGIGTKIVAASSAISVPVSLFTCLLSEYLSPSERLVGQISLEFASFLEFSAWSHLEWRGNWRLLPQRS